MKSEETRWKGQQRKGDQGHFIVEFQPLSSPVPFPRATQTLEGTSADGAWGIRGGEEAIVSGQWLVPFRAWQPVASTV